MMFAVEKDKLVDGLAVIQKGVCCYIRQPCDCKYGIKEGNGIGLHASREQTGCPEVTLAMSIIRNMTEDEYHEIMGRDNSFILSAKDGQLTVNGVPVDSVEKGCPFDEEGTKGDPNDC